MNSRIAAFLSLTEKRLQQQPTSLQFNLDQQAFNTFQELKAKALKLGWIDPVDEQLIDNWLGTSADEFNERPVAVKFVCRKLYCDLLEREHLNPSMQGA